MPRKLWPRKDAGRRRYSSGRCLPTFDPAVSEWGNPACSNTGGPLPKTMKQHKLICPTLSHFALASSVGLRGAPFAFLRGRLCRSVAFGEGREPGEVKHLSTRRKRNQSIWRGILLLQIRDSLSSGERKGKSPKSLSVGQGVIERLSN